MALSVTDVNRQRDGKKGKNKNKDIMGIAKEWLAKINTTMSALTGRVDDKDRHIEELESERDVEELRGEKQTTMTSMVPDFKKELQVLQASEAAKGCEFQAYKTEVKV